MNVVDSPIWKMIFEPTEGVKSWMSTRMMMWVPRVGVSVGSGRLGSSINERRNSRKVARLWMCTCLKIGSWFMLGLCARGRKKRESFAANKKERG